MTPSVLVTDGGERAALAIVRSLGRAGHRVEVCARTRPSLAGASRYCTATHIVPDPLARPAAFQQRVGGLCRERNLEILLPVTDAALLACLPESGEPGAPPPGDARLPFPPAASHRDISDKLEVTRRAEDLGIPVPRQVVVSQPGRVPDPEVLPPFPLIVKPARSVVGGPDGRIKTDVSEARSPAELAETLAGYPDAAYPLLLQERIDGWGEGVFLLMWNGMTAAAFAHRRIREKPPTGGVSVYREAIRLDPDLRERSARLLESFDWRGVAMIEYRRAARDGRPYLMEVNGRFWGSLQLAVDAGVDFPRILVELAAGGEPAPPPAYRVGVRSRWWLGDVDHLLGRLRHRIDPHALPPGSAKTRLGATARFLVPWRPGERSEVARLSDPRPAVVELRTWLGGILRTRRPVPTPGSPARPPIAPTGESGGGGR